MRNFLRRLFGRARATSSQASEMTLTERLGSVDPNLLWPPATTTDPAAWDRYWEAQLKSGMAGFVHMFCDDGPLMDVMTANQLTTVLCVGNGVSQEARALAWAGCDVTALDLSPLASRVAEHATPPDEFLASLVGGRLGVHAGQFRCVTGDLRDPAICPGPYDVIIDRKTLQLFADDERAGAIQRVVDRLAPRGIFYSHRHDGAWRPGREHSPHPVGAWMDEHGWPHYEKATPIMTRVGWLFTSTG